MLKFIAVIALFALTLNATGQTLEVKCFRWVDDTISSADLPAKMNHSLKKSPVIKVITPQKGLEFNFDADSKALATKQKEGEILLWAPVGAQKINIIDKQTMKSYSYPFGKELEPSGVYALFLKTDSTKVNTGNQIESLWLTMNTNPQGADILIDDVAVGQTLFVGSLPIGNHKISLEINGVKEESSYLISKDHNSNIWLDFVKKGLLNNQKDNNNTMAAPFSAPLFPGGMDGLTRFLRKNIQYPTNEKADGTVIVSFVISNLGKVYNIRVVRGISAICDQEAVRVVKIMPDWIPSKANGKPISCIYQIPITFQPSPYGR